MRWQLAALIPPTSPTTTDDDANHQQEQVEQERRQREAEPLPAGAPLRILRLVDQWLAEDDAADLADWLAQDVT